MGLARTLRRLASLPLSFVVLVALSGCGGNRAETGIAPERSPLAGTESPEGSTQKTIDWQAATPQRPEGEREPVSPPSIPAATGAAAWDGVGSSSDGSPGLATSAASASGSPPAPRAPLLIEAGIRRPLETGPVPWRDEGEGSLQMPPDGIASSALPVPPPPSSAGGVAPRLSALPLGPAVAGGTAPQEVDGGADSLVPDSPAADGQSAPRARVAVAEDRGGYEAVTVFYGTDRQSMAVPGLPARTHRLWFYGAGVGGMLFGLFALMAGASSRKRVLVGLSALSISASCVMAAMGSIAWLQRDGAIGGPKLVYGIGRGRLAMGTCEVSIPRGHQAAELESPSVFRLDFVENPTKHVVLLEVAEMDTDTFFSQLRNRVEQSAARDALVFVHGFNVTFEDAARRTAQLAYDLKFQGAPILYSWPSQGGLFQYAVDETNVVWTVPHLQGFLKEVARRSGARSVHLIAHSMGNRALTSALRELSLEPEVSRPLFHEVVLTAPDIDADIFRRDLAPAILGTARRVTLYASSNDEALILSKQVHGYPRAGETGEGLVVLPGIETIDVSAVDTSLVGHSYYGDNTTVISDMVDLVRNSKSAQERRWLVTARLNDLLYWVFRTDGQAVGSSPSPPLRYR
ncbi:MAG: alpha/beta hydrolase [Thermoguttaceae bacterium]